jgi:hypothetical protein
MEKNTVLLNIQEYNNIIFQYYALQDENKHLKDESDELEEKYQALIDFTIERCIFKYYLANRSLEELTDSTSTFFAISIEDFKKLTKLGITERRIVSVIARVKKQHDAEKEIKE